MHSNDNTKNRSTVAELDDYLGEAPQKPKPARNYQAKNIAIRTSAIDAREQRVIDRENSILLDQIDKYNKFLKRVEHMSDEHERLEFVKLLKEEFGMIESGSSVDVIELIESNTQFKIKHRIKILDYDSKKHLIEPTDIAVYFAKSGYICTFDQNDIMDIYNMCNTNLKDHIAYEFIPKDFAQRIVITCVNPLPDTYLTKLKSFLIMFMKKSFPTICLDVSYNDFITRTCNGKTEIIIENYVAPKVDFITMFKDFIIQLNSESIEFIDVIENVSLHGPGIISTKGDAYVTPNRAVYLDANRDFSASQETYPIISKGTASLLEANRAININFNMHIGDVITNVNNTNSNNTTTTNSNNVTNTINSNNVNSNNKTVSKVHVELFHKSKEYFEHMTKCPPSWHIKGATVPFNKLYDYYSEVIKGNTSSVTFAKAIKKSGKYQYSKQGRLGKDRSTRYIIL
jgi:hypothetical protein